MGYKGINTPEGLKLLEGSEIATVAVGSGNDVRKWRLPKNLLTHCSPFFKAALDGSFAEASSQSISLLEDDTDAFEMFVHWMYTGASSSNEVMGGDVWILAKPWILGDKLGCPDFQDLAMLYLIDYYSNKSLTIEILDAAYGESSSNSKLRKFVLDQLLWDSHCGDLNGDLKDFISYVDGAKDLGYDFMTSHLVIGQTKFRIPSNQKERYLILGHDL